jgi:hypothetical protein
MMNRREFLTTTAAAAIAAGLIPNIAHGKPQLQNAKELVDSCTIPDSIRNVYDSWCLMVNGKVPMYKSNSLISADTHGNKLVISFDITGEEFSKAYDRDLNEHSSVAVYTEHYKIESYELLFYGKSIAKKEYTDAYIDISDKNDRLICYAGIDHIDINELSPSIPPTFTSFWKYSIMKGEKLCSALKLLPFV